MDKNVWVLMPTAGRAHVPAQVEKWKKAGYKVGLFVDPGNGHCVRHELKDVVIEAPYPGVWKAWNMLAKLVYRMDADVCVLVGDDMDPDPHKDAQQIADEYLMQFPKGWGVMQPCGDFQGKDKDGVPAAARICGSPWVGRMWIQLAYGDSGPVNAMYKAFYADEELKHYAEKMGCLWMRPDLSQFHRHWSWMHMKKQDYHERNQTVWAEDKALFERRKGNGFP